MTFLLSVGVPGLHRTWHRLHYRSARKAMSMATSKIDVDVTIVGAGFAGLYALHRLRMLGLKAMVLEAGSDVGGTWFWNRYPGARCDIESMEYSYQFDDRLAQEWNWSERYAAQPEILRYAQHVAERFDLYKDILLNQHVESARYEEPGSWVVKTVEGDEVRSKFCIMALGCLSCPQVPQLEGLRSFTGKTLHTAQWPADGVDVASYRLAVIGTGSSGVQVSTSLAETAKELFVFQRTASYVVPAQNAPLDEQRAAEIKSRYREFRAEARITWNGHHPGPFGVARGSALQISDEERQMEYERRWKHGGLSFLTAFSDVTSNPEANLTASDFVRDKIKQIVRDPSVATLLCPQYGIGGKRVCVGTGYYEMYNKSHVHLVDAPNGIDMLTPNGIMVRGHEYEVDGIVFATGFDAITGSLLRIDIRGKLGISLRQKWKDGASAYLGLGTAGFPNLFIVTGPGSPSVQTNVLPSIEQHVDWIADCLAYVRAQNYVSVEPHLFAEKAWTEHVSEVASQFLRSEVRSWWNGANIPGKPTRFLPYSGGFPQYKQKCDEVAANDYEGFALSH